MTVKDQREFGSDLIALKVITVGAVQTSPTCRMRISGRSVGGLTARRSGIAPSLSNGVTMRGTTVLNRSTIESLGLKSRSLVSPHPWPEAQQAMRVLKPRLLEAVHWHVCTPCWQGRRSDRSPS